MTAVLEHGQRLGIEGFEPFRGRDLRGVHNVKVHRNLHEELRYGRVRYSLTDLHSGLVVGHVDKVAVEYARVHVNRKAQEAIAAGGKRTVHAWVIGTLAWCPTNDSPWYGRAQRVSYHPHRSHQFYFGNFCNEDWFTGGDMVRFDEYGMWAWR